MSIEIMTIDEINEVSAAGTLAEDVSNGFVAGEFAGAYVGFRSGGLYGLAIGVGVGGFGGAIGGGLIHYMMK